jgi:hypothetical protein
MSSYSITAKMRDTTYDSDTGIGIVRITTGDAEQMLVQNIGTSEEEITLLADITGGNGPGYAYLENLDDTNYVEVGTATTVYWMKLDAESKAILPLNSTVSSLFLKANTAACDVRIKIVERSA